MDKLHRSRLRESALNRYENKYEWMKAEDYMDVRIDDGNKNRKKRFITFREFKKLKVEERKTIKELDKMGFSRMSLGFCSRFLQGFIKLSKEDFKKDLKEISMGNISIKYNIDKGDLSCLRQLYGVDYIGGNYYKRIKEEIPLTKKQIEILYGTMMGDACGDSGKRISFKHGDCQRDYILWKFDKFKEHCYPSSLKIGRSISEKYKLNNIYWMFRTKFHSEFEKCIKLFYKDGSKEVSREICSYLTPLSIAVWFMDDGTTNFNYIQREKMKYNITPIMYFCTDSFSINSCQLLVDCLRDKFNIMSRLRKAKKLKDGTIPYNIIINNESTFAFIAFIRPYIIPSMLYKIDYNVYIKYRDDKKALEK